MINKFQQGGKNQVMQFVEGLAQTLQTDPNNIIQIAKKYPEVLKQAIQTYQETQDMTKAAETFSQAAQTLQQQTQTMKHGAKLQYIKSLKHQCAEDEELIYYKKGGSVDCGCKKKKGGEIEKTEKGPIAKFKEIRKGKTGFDITAYADATGSQGGFRNAEKKKKPKSGTWGATTQYIPGKNIQRGSGNNTSEQEKKDKSAKDYYAGKQHIQGKKSGGEVKKDCGGSKVIANFKAKCGSKLKKHQQGGSLNGIPFMQQGKDLPTAPKAEKRFRENSYNTTKNGRRETTTITSQTFGYNRNWPYFRQPATIQRIIEGGDTAFVETPEHHIFTKVQPRTALKSGNTYVEYNPKYDKNYSLYGQANTVFNYPVTSQEYETLKRRFNTAWNLK